jgi:hypothetical protein
MEGRFSTMRDEVSGMSGRRARQAGHEPMREGGRA